jgi:tetratricopeptide (TPR) repeat protein
MEEAKSKAEKGIQLAEQSGDAGWKGDFTLIQAYTNIMTGNYEAGLRDIEKTEKINLEEWRFQSPALLGLKGYVYLEIGAMEQAQNTAEDLMELIEKKANKKLIRWYHYLMGWIELKKENYSDAVDYFIKPLSQLPQQRDWSEGQHAIFMDSLASVYYESGNLEKARKEYEKILSLTSGRIAFGDIYTKSFYMLGKIHEQQSNKAEAIEHYEKFLDLWKDADPGLPEVDDAKVRLAGLR